MKNKKPPEKTYPPGQSEFTSPTSFIIARDLLASCLCLFSDLKKIFFITAVIFTVYASHVGRLEIPFWN